MAPHTSAKNAGFLTSTMRPENITSKSRAMLPTREPLQEVLVVRDQVAQKAPLVGDAAVVVLEQRQRSRGSIRQTRRRRSCRRPTVPSAAASRFRGRGRASCRPVGRSRVPMSRQSSMASQPLGSLIDANTTATRGRRRRRYGTRPGFRKRSVSPPVTRHARRKVLGWPPGVNDHSRRRSLSLKYTTSTAPSRRRCTRSKTGSRHGVGMSQIIV